MYSLVLDFVVVPHSIKPQLQRCYIYIYIYTQILRISFEIKDKSASGSCSRIRLYHASLSIVVKLCPATRYQPKSSSVVCALFFVHIHHPQDAFVLTCS